MVVIERQAQPTKDPKEPTIAEPDPMPGLPVWGWWVPPREERAPGCQAGRSEAPAAASPAFPAVVRSWVPQVRAWVALRMAAGWVVSWAWCGGL